MATNRSVANQVKIEKCLALARDAAATPGEKQAAINAANRLIEPNEVPYSATETRVYPWERGKK